MATREQIESLIKLITEIANQPGNDWVKQRLSPEMGELKEHELSQIYEYCIKKIAKEQAEKFYNNFKLDSVKQKLIDDFIRMETFRRNDNFEDFCLAAFQQIEAITNELSKRNELKKFIIENRFLNPFVVYDVGQSLYIRKESTKQNIGKLIFQKANEDEINESLKQDPIKWFFTQRFRAVLFYHYFNTEIKSNQDKFDLIYDLGNYLYQARNLNHRSSENSKFQEKILNEILPNKYNYYYKFLGFIEDFTSVINKNYEE
jgi:hypothetical protein